MDQAGQPLQTTIQNANVDQENYLQLANQQTMEQLPMSRYHQQLLHEFLANEVQEVEEVTDFANLSLPRDFIDAVVKAVLEADEDVPIISDDLPVVLAKACKMFIQELTLRSWIHADQNRRSTLMKDDVVGAIERTNVFDSLVGVPLVNVYFADEVEDEVEDELEEEGLDIAAVTPSQDSQ